MQTKKNLWTTNSHHKHFSLHYYHLNFQTQTLHCPLSLSLSLSLASFSVLSSISCKKLSLVLRQREGQEQSWSETCCLAWAWLLYLEAGIFIPNGKRRCFPKKKKKNPPGLTLTGSQKSEHWIFFFQVPGPF
jgi:hypothetical protein